MTVPVKIHRLNGFGRLPAYMSEGAAGADLYAGDDGFTSEKGEWILPGQTKMIGTGIAMEIPAGYEVQIRPRSGLAAKAGVTVLNAPGTIDSDYRGEIKVLLHNTSDTEFFVRNGDRIAQMVIAPVVQAEFAIVNALADSERGAGGFGSTGVAA